MSTSLYRWTEECDRRECPGDCDLCEMYLLDFMKFMMLKEEGMTYRHECRNCRWSVLTFTDRIKCANAQSGKDNVGVSVWCRCWEHEQTETDDEKRR